MGALLDRVDMADFSGDLRPEFTDEFAPEFEQDEPSSAFVEESTASKVGARMRGAGPVLSATMRRRAEAEILLYLELGNGLCEMACARCAEFIEAHLKPIAKRAAAILARYPDLAEKLIASGAIGDWIALLAVARPVVQQLAGHHVTHSIVYPEDEQEGTDDLSQYGPYQPAH